jgi:anti-sigma B factor antagonist
MIFETRTSGDTVVITVPGPSLDAHSAPEFKEEVKALIDTSKQIVLDLSKVDFLDSSGLGAILTCLRRITGNGGKLALFGLQKQVRMLFELVRVHTIFKICATEQEAVTIVSGS